MMWQATTNQQKEETLWLTKNQDKSPTKRAAAGRKKKAMGAKQAVAADICFTPAGMTELEIMSTPTGVGSRAGVAAR